MPKIPDGVVVLVDGKEVRYGDLPVGTKYKRLGHESDFIVSEKRDFLYDLGAAHRAEFYSHVRTEHKALAERKERITYVEYEKLCNEFGANSYERRLLHQNFDDEALCKLADYCIGQAGRELLEFSLPEHYGDAVQRELAPLLVKRLREANAKLDEINEDRYNDMIENNLRD